MALAVMCGGGSELWGATRGPGCSCVDLVLASRVEVTRGEGRARRPQGDVGRSWVVEQGDGGGGRVMRHARAQEVGGSLAKA